LVVLMMLIMQVLWRAGAMKQGIAPAAHSNTFVRPELRFLILCTVGATRSNG